jgi:hypothetical protein
MAAGAAAGLISGALLVAGSLAHRGLSVGWGTVLAMAVRRTALPPLAVGLAGGAAIAAAVLRRRG